MVEKRREPLKKIKAFMEHLSSNYFNPEKTTKEILEKSFPRETNLLINEFVCQGYIRGIGNSYYLTLMGLDYLERLRQRDLSKQERKNGQLMVSATMVIALATMGNFFSLLNIDVGLKNIVITILLVALVSITVKLLINYFRKE